MHYPMSLNILTQVVVCTNPCRGIYKLMPWYALTHLTNYTNSSLNKNSRKTLIRSLVYVIRVVMYANSCPCIFTNKFHDSIFLISAWRENFRVGNAIDEISVRGCEFNFGPA